MIRELRAADVAEVAELHREAFRGAIGPVLGDRYARALLRWFLEQPDAVCLVFDFAGEVAGYVFGAPDGYGARLNRDLLPTVALAALTHPQVILHRHFLGKATGRARGLLRKLTRRGAAAQSAQQAAARAAAGTCFALTGIGVSPRHRKRKIGQQLCAAFEQRVAAAGFRRMILDVYKDNTPARHLYEAMGWHIAEDHGHFLLYDKQLPAGATP